MNRFVRNALPACAMLLASYASAAPVDCSRPALGTGQLQACRAASQSVDDLRRFIQRTQGIYILYMQDFASAVRE